MSVPTFTTLIDDFNRADGAVNAGAGAALWTPHDAGSSSATPYVTSGGALRSSSGGWAFCVSIIELESDFDLLVDVVVAGGFGFLFCGTAMDTSTWNGVTIGYAGAWYMTQHAGGVGTAIATFDDVAPAVGDTYWVSKSSTNVSLYKSSGGGAFVLIGSKVMSGLGAGAFGFQASDAVVTLDNLRGGPRTDAPPPPIDPPPVEPPVQPPVTPSIPPALRPGTFAERLYLALAPLAREDFNNDWSLLVLCNAIGTMYQGIEDVVRDTPDGPGWSALLDLGRAPDAVLPWLGQFAGARIPPGFTAEQARSYIASAAGWKRGTRDAMIGAARAAMNNPHALVMLRERDHDPADTPDYAYYLTVTTYEKDTPAADWASTNWANNPSFENPLGVDDDWDGTYVTITQDASVALYGTKSGKFVWTRANGTANFYFTYANIGSTPQWWTVSFYVRGVGNSIGQSCTLSASSHPSDVDASTAFVLSAAWQRVSVSVPVDAGDTDMTGGMQFDYAPANATVNIDGLQEEPTNGPTAYHEGSIPAGTGPVGAALRAAKPGGIVLTYNVYAGQDYATLLANHATYADVRTAYANYAAVRNDAPG